MHSLHHQKAPTKWTPSSSSTTTSVPTATTSTTPQSRTSSSKLTPNATSASIHEDPITAVPASLSKDAGRVATASAHLGSCVNRLRRAFGDLSASPPTEVTCYTDIYSDCEDDQNSLRYRQSRKGLYANFCAYIFRNSFGEHAREKWTCLLKAYNRIVKLCDIKIFNVNFKFTILKASQDSENTTSKECTNPANKNRSGVGGGPANKNRNGGGGGGLLWPIT